MNTKQLRQKILDLAIRGKLVPQDPNDEPASVLLERILAEKERLVKEGKIKRDKNESFIVRDSDRLHYEQLPDGSRKCIENEIPFDVPDGWAWVRLNSMGQIVGGGTPSTNNPSFWENGNIAWITPADLSGYAEKYIAKGGRNINDKGLAESSAQIMPAGSVLFSSRAPIGYIAISANAVCTNQGFKSITPYILKINEYLYYYLTTRVEDIRSRASGTTFKEISGTEFGNTIVGIPPLAEQRRIVTAIESAFAVIDEIERNKSDLQSAVAAAKSKILSLAIRGKLVPQDLDDDPASVLLERIRTEKESLIKTGKIKGDKNNSAIVRGDDNSYYQELPESWEQVFIGETHSIIRGITFPATAKQKSCADGVVSCVTTGSVQSKYNSLADVFIPECYVRNSAQWLKYNDIIMSSANSRELVGKTCLWKEHTRKTFGGFLTVVRASKHIFPTYSFFVLQYLWKSGAFIDSSTQTTNIANINNSILASTSFPLPSLAEQRRIVAAIETAFEQLDNIAAMLE
ncbi:hypothetical protein FACS189427_08550 [Planctomycetales bacterium]|nr:hypothetical protein FACS189427_08550 [Planctomycetales bacterium]